jgi:RNA 3'-terminal phosphate cyclase (ATP)
VLTIDGSFKEGGGQILRTALALSLVTGKPFRIEKIRAGRDRPGLLRQHLAAVTAAAAVGGAHVTGAALGSRELTFAPAAATAGDYSFAVGTAGSTTLVLQTVLPALILASSPSRLALEGGTHNLAAPPYDFLDKTFLPVLRRMGARVSARLERAGFYPAGGGRLEIAIEPPAPLTPLELLRRGEVRVCRARALVARLPRHIAERELAVVERQLAWDKAALTVEVVPSDGPGNVLLLEVESDAVTEVFTGFGERGLPAEMVAEQAVQQARRYLEADVAAGEHLADQLLVPMALLRGGAFSTLPLTRHAETNIDVIHKFLDVPIAVTRPDPRGCRVTIGR